MPTQAATKPKRETWLDLLPDDAPEPSLITRDELIGTLKDRGVDINEVTLVYWEKSGVLPRPVRRWNTGAPRAMYPIYAIDTISYLRGLQAEGRTLDQIAPLVRAWALNVIKWHDPLRGALAEAQNALLKLAITVGGDVSTIRIAITNDADEEVFADEFPVPAMLRPPHP